MTKSVWVVAAEGSSRSLQVRRQACSGFMCQCDDDDVVVAVFGARWFGETLESRNLRRCNGSQILFTLPFLPLLGNNPHMSVQRAHSAILVCFFFGTLFQHITKLPSGSSSRLFLF
jgi:hypothetical protein